MQPFGFDLTMFQSEQTLIPFLFILAVVFGAVNTANVFKNKGVNFLVSLALAFFAASNTAFVNFLWSQFGSISIFFIAMFFIIFVLEVFGVRKEAKKGEPSGALFINGVILFILLSIGLLYIDMIPPLPYIGGGENLFLFFVLIIIALVFWLAFKVGGEKEKQLVPVPVRG
ncbi:MAG: hypothetical protein GTN40_04900 [Candidatus Aenigmarchaeota archaeon]|nr:hypothetical protein [Candidatus Aenigmarchaeota archaeon]